MKVELTYQFDHRMSTARNYEHEGKYLHALQVYNSIMNEYPDRPEVYYSIAEIYEHFNVLDPAILLMKDFLADEPEHKEMRLFLGQFLLRNARWEEAIEFLQFLLPEEEPVAAFFLGYSYFMLKEYESAKINFLNFIGIEKQTELKHEAHIYLAKIELQLDNFKSALNYAKKADVIYSNFWELNLIYAITYYNLGMYAHAVTSAEKAIKLNSEESAPYEWAGKIYLKLGDYEKAEARFLKYIELIEEVSSDVYTKLAEACLKIEKTKDALAYFDVALKIDPQNQVAAQGKSKAARIIEKFISNE